MSVYIFQEEQFEPVKKAGILARQALDVVCNAVKPGISTLELDRLTEEYIRDHGGIPTFKGYMGFPASLCASLNHEVVHGIPTKERILKEGDIASFDIGATIKSSFNGKEFNYIGDNARTVPVGEISPKIKKLLDDTEASLYKGIECCRENFTIKQISQAVYDVAKQNHYGVVRLFGGHGVNSEYHAEPFIPNWPEYFEHNTDTKIEVGMLLCIEPMFNLGSDDVRKLKDNWTIVTADHKLSAHFEHSILITKDGPYITTIPNG